MSGRLTEAPGWLKRTAVRRLGLALAVVAWAVTVACGLALLWVEQTTPGATGTIATTWPRGLHVPLASDRPTLLMIAHPRCACTRASVAELARLMSQIDQRGARLQAYALFLQPSGGDADWQTSPLFEAAARIPGVTALWDRDGADAQRLGAATSGHVLLYAADGRLRFSGGITPSRGHQGDTEAAHWILAAIADQAPGRHDAKVLGCALTEAGPDNTGATP